jgi:hypothetical protein
MPCVHLIKEITRLEYAIVCEGVAPGRRHVRIARGANRRNSRERGHTGARGAQTAAVVVVAGADTGYDEVGVA